MFVYEGVEYKSKAEAVRVYYDNGELLDTPGSKKEWAKKFGMTIQSVHGRIKNHLSKNRKQTEKKERPKKKVVRKASKKTSIEREASKSVVESTINKQYNGTRVVFPNNTESDTRKEIYDSDPNKIFITWSPNPWGLPVTEPPIPVIDPKFKNEQEARAYIAVED